MTKLKFMKTGLLYGAAISAALVLTACSSTKMSDIGSDSITTGSTRQGSLRSTMQARKAWSKNPSDLRKGMRYVAELKALEQYPQMLTVLEQLLKYHPKNTKLQAYYGKQLLAQGQVDAAKTNLLEAVNRGETDWRVLSALGSAYDQKGEYLQARQYYNRALKSRPGEIKIINNMAMSYALEGKFARAEALLRKANSTPSGRAEPRIRQNLALVVGLQGRFDEAKTIASRDLPPKQVEANMVYLRKMLGSGNSWNKLKKSG